MKKRTFALLLIAALLLSLCGCAASDYKNAEALMEEGKFADAAAAFAAIGDYKDAAAKAEEARNAADYESAAALLAEGSYADAAAAFEALGDYKDAADQAKEAQNAADYESAEALLAEGSYADAAAAFAALGDYKDAAAQAEEAGKAADYEAALALLDAEDYDAAVEAFTALGDYKDSAECLATATEMKEKTFFVGEWILRDFAFGPLVNDEMMEATGDEAELAALLDFSDVTVDARLSLTEDTYIFFFDEESSEKALGAIAEEFKTGFMAYFEKAMTDELAAEGLSLEMAYSALGVDSIEGIFEVSTGMTVDEFVESTMQEISGVFSQQSSGSYEVKDGQPVFSDDEVSYDADKDELLLVGLGSFVRLS